MLVAPGTPVEGAIIISPTGSDANAGTLASPYRSLLKASEQVAPGGTIYMRGGYYDQPGVDCYYSDRGGLTSERLDNVVLYGTEADPITVSSYPGEWAIFDGMNHSWHPRTFGDGLGQTDPALIRMFSEYVTWEHFELRNSVGKGIRFYGNYTTFRHIYSHHHHDDCIYTQGVHNLIEDSDFHDSYPIATGNNSGDGVKFSRITDGGPYRSVWSEAEHPRTQFNTVRRCRMWNNCDDGLDMIGAFDNVVEFCMSFNNGYPSQGNGQGYKCGGNTTTYVEQGNLVRFNLAARNRAYGFTNNSGSAQVFYNNTSWRNNRGFDLRTGGEGGGYNLALNNANWDSVAGTHASVGGGSTDPVHFNNSWNIGAPDPLFESLDPESADFLRLGAASPLIDAGALSYTDPKTLTVVNIDTGLYAGALSGDPDLGYLQRAQFAPTIGRRTPVGAAVVTLADFGGVPNVHPMPRE